MDLVNSFLIFTKLCILFENKKKKFGVRGTLKERDVAKLTITRRNAISKLIEGNGYETTTDGFSLVLVTEFSSYRCNSTSYTLRARLEHSITENACRVCLVKDTTLPICQRRLYAPMASCIDPQSWRFSFYLKEWPNGNIPGRGMISMVSGL